MLLPTENSSEFDINYVLTETFVERVEYFESVPSTNTVALEKFCPTAEVKTPLLVLASQQTAGRGRGANQWWSVGGSLTFSLVIHPANWDIAESAWPKISLVSGLSVCLALRNLALEEEDFKLKWPNDVHLNGRKVSGVLVEVGPRSSQTLVIGVGINVNNSFRDAPPELQSTATSMVDVANESACLTDVLVQVLVWIEQILNAFRRDEGCLATMWQQHCELKGKRIEVESGNRIIAGHCQGIDRDGALVLLTDAGTVRLFSGVVSRVD